MRTLPEGCFQDPANPGRILVPDKGELVPVDRFEWERFGRIRILTPKKGGYDVAVGPAH